MAIVVLLILMIIGAFIATETRDLLSSVISVGAVGFLLCLTFLYLKAPDIAITQMVVEVLALIILIRATLHRDLTFVKGIRAKLGLGFSLFAVVVVTVLSIPFFQELPKFGHPLLSEGRSVANFYLQEGLRRTGAANITTSVLLDFRMYDTLGEATILFTSILGALAILRRPSHKKIKEKDKEEALK